jgi:hypothetical protein
MSLGTYIIKEVKMEVSFCEGWFRHHKKIVGPMTEKKAKELEKKGKPYTVIIGKPDHPKCFIEINLGCYGVSFLDEYKREYLSYSFDESGNNMLFLDEVISREFEGTSDTVLSGTVYWFSPDGTVKIEKSQAPFQKAELIESKTDVSKNWEKKPEFGKYESLIREER